MILVSGATGQLGKEVVTQLLNKGAKGKFAVLARDAGKAKFWADQGIEVRIADFDQPDSLVNAFAGIETFLFISTMSMDRGTQQIAVVDAAAKAGVGHIFYTGLAIRDITTSAVRDVMQSHFDTEDHIRRSGMKFTFLRNTMYAEALLQILGPNVLNDGIFLSGGTGAVPYASRAELGEATANALLGGNHDGKTYDMTGASSWSYADIAAGLSRLTGNALPYVDIPEAALADGLKAAGLPDFVIWLTLGTVKDIRDGQYDLASDAMAKLLGREPKDLDATLNDLFA